MGFLSRLKNTFSPELNVSEHWIQPASFEEIEQIFSKKDRISTIFKHSMVCPTSSFVLRSIEKILPDAAKKSDFYIIEVKSQRKFSNYIAKKTGVRHESPQLIVMNNGEVFWHASHSAIYPERILEHIEKLS